MQYNLFLKAAMFVLAISCPYILSTISSAPFEGSASINVVTISEGRRKSPCLSEVNASLLQKNS